MGYETHSIRGVSQRYGRRELGGETGVQKNDVGDIVIKCYYDVTQGDDGQEIGIPAVLNECRVEKIELKVETAFDGTTPVLNVKKGSAQLIDNVSEADDDLSVIDTAYADMTLTSTAADLLLAAGDTITITSSASDDTVGKASVVVTLKQL